MGWAGVSSGVLGSARRVGRGDRWAVRHSARLPATRADGAVRAVSLAANHSLLWVGAGSVLATRRGPTRRAAVRGLGAVAVSSVLANGVGKNLFPRRRPAVLDVPRARHLPDPPMSSSFPSGHAASAAAFATAVAMEHPPALVVVAPLAALVGYSRVHTGVHWPSDVAAGALLGTAVALATRRWWPVRPGTAAAATPSVEAPALPGGEGLLLLVNPSSGPDDTDLGAVVREHLPQVRVLSPDAGDDVTDALRAALAEHPARALGVCGGDGTVQALAGVAVEHDLPLLVLPGGTLNHFARDLGAASADTQGVADLAAAVAEGHAVAVDLAQVRLDDAEPVAFVNTASIGGYPDVVRLREKWSGRWGRWPAAGAALARVVAAARPVRLTVDGEPLTAWIAFVGNGRYTPSDGPPLERSDLASGVLDVRLLRADGRLSRVRLVAAALLGTVGSSRAYLRREVSSVELTVQGEPVSVALDGEVVGRARRLRFRAAPGGLVVYR